MEPLHVAHLVVLAMWLGVVITEVLFEFDASDAESLAPRVPFAREAGANRWPRSQTAR